TAAPGGAQKVSRVAPELVQKLVAIQLTSSRLVKDTDPIQITPLGRQAQGLAESFDFAKQRFLSARGGQQLPQGRGCKHPQRWNAVEPPRQRRRPVSWIAREEFIASVAAQRHRHMPPRQFRDVPRRNR